MSIVPPPLGKGPHLTLELPASTDAVAVALRNAATKASLALAIPAAWGGQDLYLDWDARTIRDSDGVDRSALLDPSDNSLWVTPAPFPKGEETDIEIEAVGGPLAASDDFNQSAGALNGKNADKGGAWATSGAATDYNVSGGAIARSTTSDANNRLAHLSTLSLGNLDAELDFTWTAGGKLTTSGLVLPAPAIVAAVISDGSENAALWVVREGSSNVAAIGKLTLGTAYRVHLRRRGTVVTAALETVSGIFLGEVSLGGLPTTKSSPGILDQHTGGSAATRTYDRLRVFAGAYAAKATLRWLRGYV